jgi:hypothetical protein
MCTNKHDAKSRLFDRGNVNHLMFANMIPSWKFKKKSGRKKYLAGLFNCMREIKITSILVRAQYLYLGIYCSFAFAWYFIRTTHTPNKFFIQEGEEKNRRPDC